MRQDEGDEPVGASSGETTSERQGGSALVFIATSLIWCSHRLVAEEILGKKVDSTPSNTSSFIVKED